MAAERRAAAPVVAAATAAAKAQSKMAERAKLREDSARRQAAADAERRAMAAAAAAMAAEKRAAVAAAKAQAEAAKRVARAASGKRALAATSSAEPPPKRALASSPDAVAKRALLNAVEKGQLPDVKRYLAMVDPNYFGDDGNTPLHLAAKHSRHAILQVLLEKGADVRATNHSQQTALHAAALADTKGACCELLLRAVPDVDTVNVQDKTQRTALHYAALKGNARAVELLLEHGADPSIKNIKGTTALEVASTTQVQRLLNTK